VTGNACPHAADIHDVTPESPDSCLKCVAAGDGWMHLRICLVCGHVGCCDSSKNRHARRHYHATGHSVVQSYEPSEGWQYCFAHDVVLGDARPFR
jgi:hypothetical protein